MCARCGLGPCFSDVCGHLDTQTRRIYQVIFMCRSGGGGVRPLYVCVTAEEGIECPLVGVTVYSTTFQSRRRLERGTIKELG